MTARSIPIGGLENCPGIMSSSGMGDKRDEVLRMGATRAPKTSRSCRNQVRASGLSSDVPSTVMEVGGDGELPLINLCMS